MEWNRAGLRYLAQPVPLLYRVDTTGVHHPQRFAILPYAGTTTNRRYDLFCHRLTVLSLTGHGAGPYINFRLTTCEHLHPKSYLKVCFATPLGP